MQKVTITQVAKESGLAISSVSKILNGQEHLFDKETCKRVKEVAQRLNYQPNPTARSLRSGRTMVVDLYVSSTETVWLSMLQPYINNIFAGVTRSLFPENYKISLRSMDHLLDPDSTDKVPIGHGADGIIFILLASEIETFQRQCLDKIKATNKPFVAISGYDVDFEADYVGFDHMGALKMAADHLLAENFDSFGLFRMSRPSPEFSDILALEEMLKPHSVSIYNSQFGRAQDAYEIASELCQKNTLPRALFFHSEWLESGAKTAILEHGFRIPEDVALLSYGNLLVEGIGLHQTTLVDTMAYERGVSAGEIILSRIQEKKRAEGYIRKIYQPKLYIQNSTQKGAHSSTIDKWVV